MKRCMQNFAPKFYYDNTQVPVILERELDFCQMSYCLIFKRAQFVPKKTFLKQCENTGKRDDLCTLNMSVELFYEFFRGDNVKLRS
eukprot:UN02436